MGMGFSLAAVALSRARNSRMEWDQLHITQRSRCRRALCRHASDALIVAGGAAFNHGLGIGESLA